MRFCPGRITERDKSGILGWCGTYRAPDITRDEKRKEMIIPHGL